MSRRRAILIFGVVGASIWLWISFRDGDVRQTSVATAFSLGEITLELPSGTRLDAGPVEPETPVRFSLEFVNRSSCTIDLSHFRLSDFCCHGGSLVASTETVEPNQLGALQFELIASLNPGPTTVQVVLEYVPLGPWPESQSLPTLPVHLTYDSQSHGICHWEFQILDFGDITTMRTHQRTIQFVSQLTDDSAHPFSATAEYSGLRVAVGKETERKGIFQFRAQSFDVELSLTPASMGRDQSLVVAKTPVGNRALLVRWNSVAEYHSTPERLVFLRQVHRMTPQRWRITNSLSHKFTIVRAESDVRGLRLEHETGLESFQTVVANVESGESNSRGNISIVVADESGHEHKETFPCAITVLDGAVTPIEAE